jgi:hypothetical protein
MISPKIRSLYDAERDAAWEKARDRVTGKEVNADMLKSASPSKYPVWIISLVVGLCFVLLIAGFFPSAYRLHQAGQDTFCEAVNATTGTDPRCGVVGAATIIMAETGQIVFFLALAVLGKTYTRVNAETGESREVPSLTNRVFWAGVWLATTIALVGNAHVAKPWDHGGHLFAYLETFGPPLLVMGIGYALKELLLYSIEQRHAFRTAFQKAEEERLVRYNNPEATGDEWLKAFSLALRDALRKANARHKDAMAELTPDEWRFLIKQEMNAADYIVNPAELTSVEVEAEKKRQAAERRQAEIREMAKVVPPSELTEVVKAEVISASQSNGHVKVVTPKRVEPDNPNEEVWLNDETAGTWTARSAASGYVLGTDFQSSEEATRRLRDYHYRRARNERIKASSKA